MIQRDILPLLHARVLSRDVLEVQAEVGLTGSLLGDRTKDVERPDELLVVAKNGAAVLNVCDQLKSRFEGPTGWSM